MAEIFTLGEQLYRSKKSIKATGTRIGTAGVVGIGMSKHRKGVMTAPKMSTAARIFDFLDGKNIAAYESPAAQEIYCEIGEDTSSSVKVICKENATGYEYKCSANAETIGGPNASRMMIPAVLLQLSSIGPNEELQELFKGISKGLPTCDTNDLMAFCDSFYFGSAKDMRGTMDFDLTDEEITAAFRSGTFIRMDIGNLGALTRTSDFEKSKSKVKSSRKTTKDKSGDKFMQECKEGKYRIDYDWPECMKGYIVDSSYLDKFEYLPEFEEIIRKIKFRATRILERMDLGLTGAEAIGKDALNIALIGKPGTGKTALAYALSAATGMPISSTIWQKNSEEDEGEGKTKIVDGAPKFVETYSLLAHQYGGIDVNEEINLADPGVTMGVLGQKAEYPYIVKKNGYEAIVRHPLNVLIATMNVGTSGSNALNEALKNRFPATFQLEDPTRSTFINILMKATGQNEDACAWVYDAYDSVVSYLKDPDVNEDDICMGLSIRTCIGAIENMEEGQDPIRALKNSIVGSIAITDREVADRVFEERIKTLKNPSFDLS